MAGAPATVEAEIAIAERTGERDVADVGRAAELRRRRFERRKPARYLAGLVVEPLGFVGFRLAPARLVHRQDRRIENAVAQRLQAQGGEPRHRIARHDFAAASAMIEIFQDDARVVPGVAVLAEQRRNLAERILLPDRVVW